MNIVLTAMIKNEERTVARMLDSCVGVITHAVIVDTGSTDRTVEIAAAWLAEQGVPGVVETVPFRDFGHTRTETIRVAREWVRETGLDPCGTFLLLLDADMILERRGFEPAHLRADALRVAQYGGSLSYFNVRLVRASVDVRYVGRTHEYVDLPEGCTTARYDGLRIQDRGDGGCKADKFARDERLLLADLAERPGDPRTLYYLATTYEALGNPAEAIRYYTERLAAGGFEEEAWMAQVRRGIVHRNAGDAARAEADFVAAWGRRPWRTEPLAHLGQLYLDTGRQRHACAIALAALGVPYPADDLLFVEGSCYHDDFHRILSIGDYYAGRRYDGAGHADRLILRRGALHKHNALQNATWYLEPLPARRTVSLDGLVACREGWHACNPSIIRDVDGYVATVRSVNYTIRPDGSYDYPGFVASETFAVHLSPRLDATACVSLANPPGREGARIRGIEDVRLYLRDHEGYHGLGVRVDGEEDTPQVFACSWGMDGGLRESRRISPAGRTDKNWLPFRGDGGPRALASTGPLLRVVDLDGRIVAGGPQALDCDDFRGGAGPIRFAGGWLWVIHQVTVRGGMTRRTYLHRLVWVDDFDRPERTRVSRPFCFREQTIEFCAGLCDGPDGLVFAYGVMDRTAAVAVVDPHVVRALLRLDGTPDAPALE